MKRGDDVRWADPAFDDRDWENITDAGIPLRAGIFWVRYHVRGRGRLAGEIRHKVGAAYDLYWDGKLMARSGVPGNSRAEERVGKLDTVFSIPTDWLREGD